MLVRPARHWSCSYSYFENIAVETYHLVPRCPGLNLHSDDYPSFILSQIAMHFGHCGLRIADCGFDKAEGLEFCQLVELVAAVEIVESVKTVKGVK